MATTSPLSIKQLHIPQVEREKAIQIISTTDYEPSGSVIAGQKHGAGARDENSSSGVGFQGRPAAVGNIATFRSRRNSPWRWCLAEYHGGLSGQEVQSEIENEIDTLRSVSVECQWFES